MKTTKKQHLVFALILILALGASPALAQYTGAPAGSATGGGGYSGPVPAPITVAQAKDLRDDSWVTLRGHITNSLGGEDYEFTDATGTIHVDIDHKYWGGQSVGPNDLVEISGELDKDWSRVEIDVKRVQKL